MRTITCDGCSKAINTADDPFFAVDYDEPPPPLEDDEVAFEELKVSVGHGDAEFHLCSPDCLASWGFSRALAST